MSLKEVQQDALYPIREVSKLTGVNSITLRAWERRYNLIEPVRTESGHRLYTQNDIDTLHQVTKLTEQGIPISRVKPLLEEVKVEAINIINTDQTIESQLVEAVLNCELDLTNRILDTLFADFPETVWQGILFRLIQKISEENNLTAIRFSEAVLLPRLNSRLHLTLRTIKTPYQVVWLQAASEACHPVLISLVALDMIKKGYYPLVQLTPELDDEQLLEQLQSLKCQGLVLINHTYLFEEASWQSWTDAHPSYEMHLYLNQNEPEIAQKMQVSYFNLNDL